VAFAAIHRLLHSTLWFTVPDRFEVSSDLPLIEGHVVPRAPAKDEWCFQFAPADEPDGWGMLPPTSSDSVRCLSQRRGIVVSWPP
jgi:hypothetical protein